MSADCVFCKIIAGDIPSTKILETKTILVIEDINPKAPVHYLVIPKAHLATMLDINDDDSALAWDLIKTVRDLGRKLSQPQAFNVIANNGQEAGQSVSHLHWHFLAGKNIYSSGFSL